MFKAPPHTTISFVAENLRSSMVRTATALFLFNNILEIAELGRIVMFDGGFERYAIEDVNLFPLYMQTVPMPMPNGFPELTSAFVPRPACSAATKIFSRLGSQDSP